MNILNILKSLFINLQFWLTAAEKEFKKLPVDLQDALIQQGKFGQIIKQNFRLGLTPIYKEAERLLGMSPEQTTAALKALAAKLKVEGTAGLIIYLQETVGKELDNSAWDSLWTVVTGQLQIIATGGKLNWATLAIGITEFVYQRFIKGKV